MLSDITGMQLMCMRMSQLQAEGGVSIEHAALAKLNTGDAARRICAMARDILDGKGILLDHQWRGITSILRPSIPTRAPTRFSR